MAKPDSPRGREREPESLPTSSNARANATSCWIRFGTDPFRYHNGLFGSAARIHYSVSNSIADTEQALADLHRFTARQLDAELLWSTSMPCVVHGDAGIPIAEFGSSNVGQMKRIYRNGLSVRYGGKMQAIAGIHYNFLCLSRFG
ncbi:MAG: hypothetical protein CM15mP74_26160 [Halieaceae bacterium]|nr:MAG: hypothetical protein CM15mP74_26160 [Halieaceae bacterium]